MSWFRSRRAVLGYLILAAATALALAGVQHNVTVATHDRRYNFMVACHDRQHQYDAIHAVIEKSYQPTKPSPALLKAFPAFKPFYTPSSPVYQAQALEQRIRRDAVLGTLGTRPTC